MAARPYPASPDLEAARRGDAQAFDRLVRPLLGGLLALSRRISPARVGGEELLQEALIRAHRGVTTFRFECSFRAWIVRILYRLATEPRRLDPARPLPGQTDLAEDLVDLPDRLDEDPLHRVTTRELVDRVEEAMERLPHGQRAALHLRAVEGFSYDEIATVLGSNAGAVRQSVLKARRKLRDRLEDQLGDER
ncbi:MAG: RNA polymerase sigma factor [Planctomycetes bacterium]|nr:RNA polymerase sigma factor [Planctomycetota bacterium]